MVSSPYVSVVVPTFNRAESLRCTLQALERQTCPKDQFEVIVVDDGSSDHTVSMLAEQVGSLKLTLKVFRQENAGPGKARNRGAQEASGEIVLYIDDDIEPVESLIDTHASHHRANENLVVIGPMSPDPALSKVEPMWIAWEHAMLQRIYQNVVAGVWPKVTPNLFYSGNASLRRHQLLAIGGFDTTFKRQEDVEMAVRLFRSFNVDFLFDPVADGLHRPQRSFESWYKVPFSYGQYDVIRFKRGDLSVRSFEGGFDRHAGTILLANIAMTVPAISPLLSAFIRSMAQIFWNLGSRSLALSAMSALYNVKYMEGAAHEMGSRSEVKRLMLGSRTAPQQ